MRPRWNRTVFPCYFDKNLTFHAFFRWMHAVLIHLLDVTTFTKEWERSWIMTNGTAIMTRRPIWDSIWDSRSDSRSIMKYGDNWKPMQTRYHYFFIWHLENVTKKESQEGQKWHPIYSRNPLKILDYFIGKTEFSARQFN